MTKSDSFKGMFECAEDVKIRELRKERADMIEVSKEELLRKFKLDN